MMLMHPAYPWKSSNIGNTCLLIRSVEHAMCQGLKRVMARVQTLKLTSNNPES
jgi:hypothetical protein